MRKLKYYNIQDKVILLGRRDDVFHIYKLFDIFILTSKSEGFPNVLAEAMINNNICYSTDVGEASLILRRKNFIIPKDDVIKSARISQNMINQKNSYKWKRIKKENKTHIMNSFSLKKMVINYLDVWKNNIDLDINYTDPPGGLIDIDILGTDIYTIFYSLFFILISVFFIFKMSQRKIINFERSIAIFFLSLCFFSTFYFSFND